MTISTFVAMQYYWGILNRSYLIAVTDLYICGARVGGLVAAPHIPTPEWLRPEFYVSPRLLRRYKGLDVTTPAFLKQDQANFQIPRHTILRIDSHPKKWGMATVPYSGRLVLHTASGKSYEFILLGKQDREAIRERLLPYEEMK